MLFLNAMDTPPREPADAIIIAALIASDAERISRHYEKLTIVQVLVLPERSVVSSYEGWT
jgi:hypothetical protein